MNYHCHCAFNKTFNYFTTPFNAAVIMNVFVTFSIFRGCCAAYNFRPKYLRPDSLQFFLYFHEIFNFRKIT